MISVLMTVYNDVTYLDLALSSILNQTWKDLEIILVDDGSCETSKYKIEQLAKIDKRIQLVRNDQNIGLAASLNRALNRSCGELIARMDSDDISYLTRFEMQTEYLGKNPECDVCGGQAIAIDESGKECGPISMPESHDQIVGSLPRFNPLIHPAVMMRRKFLERAGGYNEKLRKKQDYELWARMAGSSNFHNLAVPVLKYRWRDSQYRSLNTDLFGFRVRLINAWHLRNPICVYYAFGVFLQNRVGKIAHRFISG